MSKFDTLYADVQRFYTDSLNGNLSAASVTALVRYAMETVNAMALKGSEKKALVVDVVNQLVKDALEKSELDDQMKAAIESALSLAPLLIDAAVDFAKIYGNNKESKCKLLCCFK